MALSPLGRTAFAARVGVPMGLSVAVGGCMLVTDFDDLRARSDPPASRGGGGSGAGAGGNAATGGHGGCEPSPDLDGDPANCGACGHDCRSASCVGGFCQPEPVGSADVRLLVPGPSSLFAVLAGPGDACKQPAHLVRVDPDAAPSELPLAGAFAVVPDACGFAAVTSDSRVIVDAQSISDVLTCDFSTDAPSCTVFASSATGSHPNGLSVSAGRLHAVHPGSNALRGVDLDAALPAALELEATVSAVAPTPLAYRLADNGTTLAWTHYSDGCLVVAALADLSPSFETKCADPAAGGASGVAVDEDGTVFYWKDPDATAQRMALFSFDGRPHARAVGLRAPHLGGNVVVDHDAVYVDACPPDVDPCITDQVRLWRCDKSAATLDACRALSGPGVGAFALTEDAVFFAQSNVLYRVFK